MSKKKFEPISGKDRKELEEKYYTTVVGAFRKDEIEKDFHKYVVNLQDYKFITYMTDVELRLSIKLSVDLIEELKVINNNGLDKEAFEEVVSKIKMTEEEEIMAILGVYYEIATERMKEIVSEIDRVRRVGGAWAMLVANPGLKNTMYAVYEKIVDRFDDIEFYAHGGFFLLKAIMNMHGDKLEIE